MSKRSLKTTVSQAKALCRHHHKHASFERRNSFDPKQTTVSRTLRTLLFKTDKAFDSSSGQRHRQDTAQTIQVNELSNKSQRAIPIDCNETCTNVEKSTVARGSDD